MYTSCNLYLSFFVVEIMQKNLKHSHLSKTSNLKTKQSAAFYVTFQAVQYM